MGSQPIANFRVALGSSFFGIFRQCSNAADFC
jgi:hypothetical protein